MERPIIGESKPIRDLKKMIDRVAATRTNILVIGESGTGKELVARMIHDQSPLKKKPFVPVNCGAIPENLIESEMFGHKRGSFTGAVSEKAGLFEVANGGTLFLDEVGELPLNMQVKLLRAIQERSFRKVGGTEDVKVDVRIIAATNRDLEEAVAKGTFREDLYYRLNVILLRTPPLRERKGDIRILAEHFLKKTAARAGKEMEGFEPDALEAILNHPWPGNVRELENMLERVVTLATGPKVTLATLPAAVTLSAAGRLGHNPLSQSTPDLGGGSVDLEEILAETEKSYLLAAINRFGGVNAESAGILGLTLASLKERAERHGLQSKK